VLAAPAYLLTAALLLWAAHRAVEPLSRRAAFGIAAMPLAVTGKALLFGLVFAPIDNPFSYPPLSRFRADFGVGPPRNGLLSDLYCQIIPWHKAVRWAISQGEWPLWNPFIRNGDILAAAAQPAPYFPPNLVSYLLPLPAALTYLAAVHLLVAALGAFLWARSLGCGERAAAFAAFGWMAADSVVWWIGWPLGAATAAAPWIFLGVRRVVVEPGTRSTALLVAAFAWTLLAGHPETAAHSVLLAAAYGVFEVWPSRRAAWWRPAAWAAGAGAVALLLCAIYLLPILDAFPQTVESRHRGTFYASIDRSAEPAEAARRMTSFAVPFRFGLAHRAIADDMPPSFDLLSVYAGSVLWPLALFGFAASRRRERWFLGAMGVFCALAAVSAPPVADLLASLPLFDVAINERLAYGGALAVVLLAALGVEAATTARDFARWSGVALVAAAIALASVWAAMIDAGLPGDFLLARSLWLLCPLALVGLLALWPRAAGVAVACMFALLVGQRAWELAGFYPSLPAKIFFPRVAPFGVLPEDAPPYRVAGRWFAMPANIGTMWEIEDPRGYQAMSFRRLAETYPLWSVAQGPWFNRIDDVGRPFLDFLNVRYALVDDPLAKAPRGWKVVRKVRRLQLWENRDVAPRAFVPRNIFRGGNWPMAMEQMNSWDNFRRRVWIESESSDPRVPVSAEANGRGEVEVERDGTGYRIAAAMEEPGWIVTSVTAWRGWRALADGKELPLAYANHAFVAIDAPAGQYDIRLRYRPASFVLGAWTSATTAVLLAVLALWRRRQRWRSASIASP
jgi:hypothetical protein